ncbi:MAG TPA: hypothetical protein VFV25_10345 [Methylibium sp.]
MRLAESAQQRHEDAIAGIAVERILRAGIVEQRMAGGAHQHGRALADIGRDQLEAAGLLTGLRKSNPAPLRHPILKKTSCQHHC